MKINLGEISLSRGIEYFECPENFRIQSLKEIQIASFLRAKAVKIFDRGNVQIIITFKVARQHESTKTALTHLIKHTEVATDAHGKAFFDLEDSQRTAFYLQNATIRNLSSYIDGITSHHSYEIIGSEIKHF